LKQSISAPALSSRKLSVEAAGLIPMEFPVAKPRDADGRRNGRLSRILVVNALTAIASVDAIN
jgi:hypothetical protein